MKCLLLKNIPADEIDCSNGIIAETFDRVDVVLIQKRPERLGGDIAHCRNEKGAFLVYLAWGDGQLEE